MDQNGLFPVTFTRHAGKRWKRFTSFDFATNQSDCPIVLQEVPQVAAAFPIVFKKTNEGLEPRAVFSLVSNLPNPFVSKDGRWFAAYVPSDLRCHPFVASRLGPNAIGENPVFQLMVKETSELVTNDPNDERFFDESGASAPALVEVRTFLQNRQAAREETLALSRRLSALNLFEPADTYEGVVLPAESHVILTRQLNNLSRSEKLSLLESSAIQLAHAHQVSLSHCSWLASVHHQSVLHSEQEKYTKNSDVSGFLCAVAQAQNADLQRSHGV